MKKPKRFDRVKMIKSMSRDRIGQLPRTQVLGDKRAQKTAETTAAEVR
jgi:hypothetical protein